MSTRPTPERLAAIRSHVADMVSERGPGHRWGIDLLAEIDALTEDLMFAISGEAERGAQRDAAFAERDSLRAEVARLTAERETGLAAMTRERDEWRETARRFVDPARGGGR